MEGKEGFRDEYFTEKKLAKILWAALSGSVLHSTGTTDTSANRHQPHLIHGMQSHRPAHVCGVTSTSLRVRLSRLPIVSDSVTFPAAAC